MFASSIKIMFLLLISLQGFSKKEDKPKKPTPIKTPCRITVVGNDYMQFKSGDNKILKEIRFPAACLELTIDFSYKGTLPASSMGHSLVFAKKADRESIAKDALAQGREKLFHPSKNNPKVIASSHYTLGGGAKDKKKDVIVIKRDELKDTNDLIYFCAFPRHCTKMSGPFVVEPAKGKEKSS